MKRLLAVDRLGGYSARFWLLALFLAFTFCIGGGSRPDIESLMILRPVSALVLAYALSGLSRHDVRKHRVAFAISIAAVLLCAIQLVPLPPSLWAALPGRDLITEIDHVAGLGDVWRPINMVPSDGWNALFAWLPPLAVLTLAVQLRTDEKWALLPVLVAIALVSGIVAVLQLGGPPKGALYFYRITNYGEAVGLFANRNHQAVFLASLFPMLSVAVWGRVGFGLDQRFRGMLALAIGLFLVPLILVTGSRAGLAVGLLGLIGAGLFHAASRTDTRSRGKGWSGLWIGVIAAAVVLAIAATVLLDRAVALDRLFSQPAGEELRYRAWGPMWHMALDYFPVGSGFGSFPDLFRVHEPHALLAPTTFRHAHNDWLELLFTGGVPALLLLFLAVVATISAFLGSLRAGQDRGAQLMAQLGFCVILMLAAASVVDYPLRVPSMACLFAVAVTWAGALGSPRIGAEKV